MSGKLPRRTSKVTEVSIGSTRILKLPDLTDDERWETSELVSSIKNVGRELPLRAVVSPNAALHCTLSSSLLLTQTSVQPLPMPRTTSDPRSISSVASALVSAVLARKATTDLTHFLSHSSMSLSETSEILYHAMTALDTHYRNGLLHLEILGVALETYRMRAIKAETEHDRDMLVARWQAAHDMCSLIACNVAFDDCRDGEAYDLEAVWQLVGLCTYIINFIERLIKQCVLSSDLNEAISSKSTSESGEDLFGSGSSSPAAQLSSSQMALDTPILMHLLHPRALDRLTSALAHVRRFRAHVGSLSARGENAQIAKDVLVDLIDCSGVDLGLLAEVLSDVKGVSDEDSRRSLAQCYPTPTTYAFLRGVIQKLQTSPNVIDKARIFVKPYELVDGLARLSFAERKDNERDVITKGVLVGHGAIRTCLRCGGKSTAGNGDGNVVGGHPSSRWLAWERKWIRRCVCGGSWVE